MVGCGIWASRIGDNANVNAVWFDHWWMASGARNQWPFRKSWSMRLQVANTCPAFVPPWCGNVSCTAGAMSAVGARVVFARLGSTNGRPRYPGAFGGGTLLGIATTWLAAVAPMTRDLCVLPPFWPSASGRGEGNCVTRLADMQSVRRLDSQPHTVRLRLELNVEFCRNVIRVLLAAQRRFTALTKIIQRSAY